MSAQKNYDLLAFVLFSFVQDTKQNNNIHVQLTVEGPT